jgi:L-fuconolactonase
VSKYEPIERVREVLASAGVRRAVLVQHLGEFDNSYLGGIAAAEPERFASVCLVDHTAPDATTKLKELAGSHRFKGVRLTTDACIAAPGLLQAAVDSGLILVLYAPRGMGEFVPSLAAFLETRPDARVVLTHFGTPVLAEAPLFGKYREIFRLARYRGVYFQVSGMKMYCPYPHEPLYGLIEAAAEEFGVQRLCWGSNYPVVGDAQDYARDLRLLLDGKLPIPPAAIADIAGGNASRLWFE